MPSRKARIADLKYILIGIASFLFYIMWYLVDGVIQTPDAATYIQMETSREPGYCLYLAFFRVVFGNTIYLDAAVIVQCAIAAAAAVALCRELQKRFMLSDLQMAVILAIQYGLTLLNRFVAQRRYSYYNSIETEGLTYSLWIFMFISMIRISYDGKKRDIAQALAWCILLFSIRKQMMISFGLFFLVVAYAGWKEDKVKRGVIRAAVLVLTGLMLAKLADCTYNLATRGVFAPHTGDSMFILGTEIYTADAEMASRIGQEEYRQLFLEILDRADEKQYHLSYAGDGWRQIEKHYSASYDRIKFDIINVVLNQYLDEKGLVPPQREIRYNEITSAMMKALLPSCLADMLRIIKGNVIHGFITTVLKVHPLLNVPAFGLYAIYIVLCLFIMKRRSGQETVVSVLPVAVLVLIAIVANVLLTAATIYSQMRYMLYNTGLFYQVIVLMLIEARRSLKAYGKKVPGGAWNDKGRSQVP